MCRISVINSPGGVIFSTPLLRELFKKGRYSGGVLFFQCHLFTNDKMKFRPNRCISRPFRSKNEPHSVQDELPGELFEGGVMFSMLVQRGGS